MRPEIQNIFKVASLGRFFNIMTPVKFRKEYACLAV
jgi:hypothetical protein